MGVISRVIAGFVITVLAGILIFGIYQTTDKQQAVIKENKCVAIPENAFYAKLREKTIKNYRRRLHKWNKIQKDQLLVNARQTIVVSQSILKVGCE